MATPHMGDALRQYSSMGLAGVVEEASPHELVRMLMDGALARIAAARGHMERREIAAKGESIGRAISIVEGLRTSLDDAAGGEVAANLERMYDYMVRQLTAANIGNDPSALKEVEGLLGQIREAWMAIADDAAADLTPELG